MSHALAIIGAGGALVGWVAVVGAIREYARFTAAGIPSPAQTTSLFPRDALVGEGLSVLIRMLLVCLPASSVAYMAVRLYTSPTRSHPRRSTYHGTYGLSNPRGKRRRLDGWLARQLRRLWDWLTTEWIAVGWAVGVITFLGYVVMGLLFAFGRWEALAAGALALAAGLLFGLRWLGGAGAAALVVFAVLVIDGGVAAFGQQLGERDGDFDSVIVHRSDGLETVSGFYLTRAGGDVYVAVIPAGRRWRSHAKSFAILAIPEGQVETLDIGPDYHLHKGGFEARGHPAVTKAAEPSGKNIYEVKNGQFEKKERVRREGSDISSTTTKNAGITITNNTTTINDNEAEPAPSSIQPVVQVYGLSALVPVGDHFCFPVGAANTQESVRLVFTAPTLGSESKDFAFRQLNLGPRGRQSLSIGLTPPLQRRMQDHMPLSVDVKITASTAAGAEATTAYHLRLLEPGGSPTVRPSKSECRV